MRFYRRNDVLLFYVFVQYAYLKVLIFLLKLFKFMFYFFIDSNEINYLVHFKQLMQMCSLINVSIYCLISIFLKINIFKYIYNFTEYFIRIEYFKTNTSTT